MKKFTREEVKNFGLTYMTDIALTKLNALAGKVGGGIAANAIQVATAGDASFFDACEEVRAIVSYHAAEDLGIAKMQEIESQIEDALNIRFAS